MPLQRSLALTFLILITPLAHAELKVANVFGDHMVLQQQMPVPVWGRTRPGQKVTVRFKDQEEAFLDGGADPIEGVPDEIMKGEDATVVATLKIEKNEKQEDKVGGKATDETPVETPVETPDLDSVLDEIDSELATPALGLDEDEETVVDDTPEVVEEVSLSMMPEALLREKKEEVLTELRRASGLLKNPGQQRFLSFKHGDLMEYAMRYNGKKPHEKVKGLDEFGLNKNLKNPNMKIPMNLW